MNLNNIFIQKNNQLTIKYLNTNVIFYMPNYFNIMKISDDLKMLSLILLFYPLDKNLMNYNFTRKSSGNNIGLAFSGGVDSSAAYCLLPKNNLKLFYHKRIITPPSMFKNDNPLLVIQKFPQEVIIIESNLEDVRILSGSYPGFLNVYSFFAGFVLLVDYLKIGYLSTGAMLESTYLFKGYEFKDFHSETHYKFWFNFFEKINLPFFFPCIPCSEILTNKIVIDNKIFSQSCVRGTDGKGCNKCYKCFRKQIINGEMLEYNHEKGEIYRILSTRPLKQAASLIYGMNKNNFDIVELKEYKNIDLSWLETFFEYTLLAIPEEYREYLKNELLKYSSINNNIGLLKNFKLN